MNRIGKLIFERLAAREPVSLPRLGTLFVERRAAQVDGSGRLSAPLNEVKFTPDELPGAPSVVALLEGAGEENARAAEIYTAWLDAYRTDHEGVAGVVIDGVGEVRDGAITASDALERAVNPVTPHAGNGGSGAKAAHRTAHRDPKKNSRLVVVLVAALLLLAVAGVWMYGRGCLDGVFGGREKAPVPAVPADAPQPAKADTVAVQAESVPAGMQNPVKGRYYVVAGVFAVPANADRLAAQYKREHGIDALKVPFRNGLTVVALWAGDDRREASRQRNYYDITFYAPDLWVWQAE